MKPGVYVHVATAKDISDSRSLTEIISRVGNFAKTDFFSFADSSGVGRYYPPVSTIGGLPHEVVQAWETGSGSAGSCAFRAFGDMNIEGYVQWFRLRHSQLPNGVSFSSEQKLEARVELVSEFLADAVHSLDGIAGRLSAPKIRFWQRDPDGGLVSIPYVTCFGNPYIDLFGADNLLSAPVFKARRYYDNAIVLQPFESLISTETKQWDEMQAKLRNHLGLRYFRDPNEKVPESGAIKITETWKLLKWIFEMKKDRLIKPKSASGEPVIGPKIDWSQMRQ